MRAEYHPAAAFQQILYRGQGFGYASVVRNGLVILVEGDVVVNPNQHPIARREIQVSDGRDERRATLAKLGAHYDSPTTWRISAWISAPLSVVAATASPTRRQAASSRGVYLRAGIVLHAKSGDNGGQRANVGRFQNALEVVVARAFSSRTEKPTRTL